MKEDKAGTIKAMPQFNQGHWEKKLDDTGVADGRYASELNTQAEYKHSVDALASYAKKHRAQHQSYLPRVKKDWGSCKKRALFLKYKAALHRIYDEQKKQT